MLSSILSARAISFGDLPVAKNHDQISEMNTDPDADRAPLNASLVEIQVKIEQEQKEVDPTGNTTDVKNTGIQSGHRGRSFFVPQDCGQRYINNVFPHFCKNIKADVMSIAAIFDIQTDLENKLVIN